jgi:hypothetical protein
MDDYGTNNQSNGDAGFFRHGRQGLHVESLLEPTKRRRSILAFARSDLPNYCPITSVEQIAFNHERNKPKLNSEGTPVLLVRLSIYFAPSSNEMVSRKSNESADGEAAGGPWRVRDFLSFVWKTYQKRDVADVSQIHPIMSFAENWHRICRADEALIY